MDDHQFFEGYYFLGASHPGIVSVVVAGVIVLFAAHAPLARAKLPGGYRQFNTYRGHMRVMRHEDTHVVVLAGVHGLRIVFLASVHLYLMLTHRIGSDLSSRRTASGAIMWPSTCCSCLQ